MNDPMADSGRIRSTRRALIGGLAGFGAVGVLNRRATAQTATPANCATPTPRSNRTLVLRTSTLLRRPPENQERSFVFPCESWHSFKLSQPADSCEQYEPTHTCGRWLARVASIAAA